MKWTNINLLPGPFAAAIQDDLYYDKRQVQLLAYCQRCNLDPETVKHYSVSDLIKPPRMRVLTRRYDEKIIEDVSAHVYRVLGNAIHMLMRVYAEKHPEAYIAEERIFTHLVVGGQVVVISGEPDLVTPADWIDDYKVTGVFAFQKGIKEEWEKQLNCYAWLRSLHGKVTKGLSITYILRDWMVSETLKKDYPPAGSMRSEVPLWDLARTQQFVLDRVAVHLRSEAAFDEELPECSADEMWEKPHSWAVIREGSARAAKVYKHEGFPADTDDAVLETAANADMELRNKDLGKKEKPYTVQFRPGERTRCLKYCSARAFCSVFKEYSAAAFRDEGGA